MSAEYVLDATALIALAIEEHVHHRRVSQWVADIPIVAVPSLVEGALVRFLLRSGRTAPDAVAILSAYYASGRCEFWPDSLSYTAVDLRHVVGHRQATDAYLVSLAESHDAMLATLDEALSRTLPGRTQLIG